MPDIPYRFRAAYAELRQAGLSDADAQSLLCTREGLWPPEPDPLAGPVERRQRITPWTLRQLARLAFLRSDLERHPEPPVPVQRVRGRCDRCPPGTPPHPGHVRVW